MLDLCIPSFSWQISAKFVDEAKQVARMPLIKPFSLLAMHLHFTAIWTVREVEGTEVRTEAVKHGH